MRRRRLEEELEQDIREHLAMETEDNIARGMSPEEARSAALKKFGNVALIKEDTRAQWRWAALDVWRADLRHALRRVRRSPGPAALAVLSLAAAFAPSVTVFSIMDRLLLTAPGVQAPEEIVAIQFRDRRPTVARPFSELSYPDFRDMRSSLRSFSGLTFQFGQGAMAALRGGRSVVIVHVVDDRYFNVLGVPIRSGPGFVKERASIVISHAFWMREFDGRADAAGRTLLLNGVAYTIDGVAAANFRGADAVLGADLWVPMETWGRTQPGTRDFRERRDVRDGKVWGRLRPGVSAAAAAAEVEAAAARLAREWPATNRYLTGYTFAPLAERETTGIRLTSIGVFLFGILLAVACANVTGILLARAEERRHETAVRQALGASRARLMREWMVESAVLSAAAAGVGLAGARLMMDWVPGLLPTMAFPIHLELSFGPRVWAYAAAMAAASTAAFGIVPAWRGSRPDLLSGLRRDSVASILRVRVPIRSLLVVLQVASAQLLLFGAGIALEAVSAVDSLAPGFDPRRPVVVATALSTGEDGSLRPIDCEAVRERLRQIGGVRGVSYGRSLPLAGSAGPPVRLELPGQEPRQARGAAAGPGFLSMLGVRFVAGRDLQAADAQGVAIDAAAARLIDPGGQAVGREIRLDGSIRQVVGVFQDVKWNSVYDAPQPRVVTLTPTVRRNGDAVFAVEVEGNAESFVAAVRGELAAALPGATVLAPKTLRQQYQDALFLERALMRVFYGLGGLALLLTLGGLHGVASALFARRSKEFAIRMALGASPRQIVGAVLANGVKLTMCGVAIGLAIGIGVALLARSHDARFTPWSAAALGLSSAAVLAAAVAAAAQPAGRVLRIEPARAMRTE